MVASLTRAAIDQPPSRQLVCRAGSSCGRWARAVWRDRAGGLLSSAIQEFAGHRGGQARRAASMSSIYLSCRSLVGTGMRLSAGCRNQPLEGLSGRRGA